MIDDVNIEESEATDEAGEVGSVVGPESNDEDDEGTTWVVGSEGDTLCDGEPELETELNEEAGDVEDNADDGDSTITGDRLEK